MSILDRYVFRSFIEPFLMCFFGIIAIWFIIDISDNFNDFLEAHAKFRTILGYYETQVPYAIIISLPVSIMLALLYCLTRMSRTNEIVSQLVAGRSVVRVLMPLILVGFALTGACEWLEWELAPHSEEVKKDGMQKIKRGKKADEVEPVLGHVFRDRKANRTWFVKKMRPKTDTPLEGVHVTQQTPEGHVVRKWYGNAIYDPVAQTWKLEKGMIINFKEDGDIDEDTTQRFPASFQMVPDWTESPLRIASAELDPAFLSVPELEEYLSSNSDFSPAQLAPYRANLTDRYALPFQCILAVFIGAPLGIVYNRRGVIGGITAAVILLVIMIMAHYFFLMLGKALRVDPVYCSWIPQIALGVVGLILLWFRSTNRDFPSFNLSPNR